MKREGCFVTARLFQSLVLIGILIHLLSASISAQGIVVLAGGGTEGDPGDTSAWSYNLYKKLIENGDVNNDNIISVAVLSMETNPTSFIPDYFIWIGQTLGETVTAQNYTIMTRNDANNVNKVGDIANMDVIFIKGGDQGDYYDEWNGTLLETHIRTVVETKNGAIGGTSAGAMSQAEYCFSGGQDMVSADVMADACTTYLEDLDGGSGIHTDFFSFVPNVTVDTHFTQRGRLGRLLGILAKAIDDHNDPTILGIGIEVGTGVFIQNDIAEVVGPGSVSFIKQSVATTMIRNPGQPLVYTDLTVDRLTESWRYNISTNQVLTDQLPAGVISVSYAGDSSTNSGELSISGGTENDNAKFAKIATYYPNDYSLTSTSASTYVKNGVAFMDAGNADNRMDKHETIYRALYDVPNYMGYLAFAGAALDRFASEPDILNFGGTLATIVIDGKTVNYKGLSPYESWWATNGGDLKAAAFTNLTIHVLGNSETNNLSLNTQNHTLVAYPNGGGSGGGGDYLAEIEPNDDTGNAQSLNDETFPLTIQGYIDYSSDMDYFQINIYPNETIYLNLHVPDAGDYDLYLLDKRGRTVARSVNDGYGTDESVVYTYTGRRKATFFIEVESYSGSSASEAYLQEVSFGSGQTSPQPILQFELANAFPNPGNWLSPTTIRYTLPSTSFVELNIYNASGQRVATLVDAVQAAGIHNVQWNGQVNDNNLSAGVYFYELKAGDNHARKKLTILK